MAAPFNRCVVKAGLNPEQTTPHILRHTAITKLVRQESIYLQSSGLVVTKP